MLGTHSKIEYSHEILIPFQYVNVEPYRNSLDEGTTNRKSSIRCWAMSMDHNSVNFAHSRILYFMITSFMSRLHMSFENYLLFGMTRVITARLHDINLTCRKRKVNKFDQKTRQIDGEI